MDIALLIRQRLKELGLEQKALANAIEVTESYVSQLLGRKKAPPAPARTDLYDRMGDFLKLPSGELARLAEIQRGEEMRKRVEPPRPLFQECRQVILSKCDPEHRSEIASIFEKQPFGELERLVTQKLLDTAQGVAREELRSEDWLRLVAQMRSRSFEQIRVEILEFLDTDVFDVSAENWVSFLDPMIESWDIDLRTFGLEIVLNPRLAPGRIARFEFVEKSSVEHGGVEPGFEEFLKDPAMSGDITEGEIDFLRNLKFQGMHPSPLYYYREMQNLRDPLHFRGSGGSTAR
jgi:transcriptional regulator with XRE-family HTH domain